MYLVCMSSSSSLLESPESSASSSEEEDVVIPEGLSPDLARDIERVVATPLGKRIFNKSLEFSKTLWDQVRRGLNEAGHGAKAI